MSAGKGSNPRPVHGETYRRNHDSIFRRFTEEQPAKGEEVDGHEYMGNGCWHAIDQHEPELRDHAE
jgi:hypothetical protein